MQHPTMKQILKKIWRFLWPAIYGLIMLIVFLLLYSIGQGLWYNGSTLIMKSLLAVGGSLALLGLYAGWIRLFEKKPARDLALKKVLPHTGAGLAIGYLYFMATVGLMFILGLYRIGSVQFDGMELLANFCFFLLVAVGEEIALRGIVFRLLEKHRGFEVALIVSALIFGFMHLGNENATWWAALAISLEAGIMLALAYKASSTLWVPIGIHWAWNFTQGNLLGFAVSGSEESFSLITPIIEGPDILTGGEFGAEASILAVLISLFISTWFYLKITKGK